MFACFVAAVINRYGLDLRGGGLKNRFLHRRLPTPTLAAVLFVYRRDMRASKWPTYPTAICTLTYFCPAPS